MQRITHNTWLGLGVIAFGGLLLGVAIPLGISSPSNVRALVLSPTFWPSIIACLLVVLGVLIVAVDAMTPREAGQEAADKPGDEEAGQAGALMRLAAMALMMVGLVVAIPYLGMVWACLVGFVVFSVIVRVPRPLLSLVVAVLLPLLLYAFFAHVAGVAVPQGELINLP
ncbi:MAG TPA: tripartite tricarboxylate transporter TctB family protein [Hyphomicrobiaceae bacterium]|nr:tripartite tricarboxylate transporter TctB family protein [Hyphomicrobiaceae bacterium]